MQITENKSYRIQVLRGIAIIAVVLLHNVPHAAMFQVWIRPFVNFSVGLFLFLSGMLSCLERWDPKKRILKVIIPYAIWTLVYVGLSNINNVYNIPLAYIKSLVIADSASVMYYVFVYIEFTLLIPIIDKMAKSKYKYIGFIISPLEIIVMRMLPLMAGWEFNKYIGTVMHVSCLGWFSYFYFGYMIGNGLLQFKYKLPTSKIFVMLIFSVCLQIVEGFWYLSLGELNCGTQLKLSAILTGIIFVYLCYRYLDEEISKPKFIHLLGDYSFAIFFSHLAVMSCLRHIPYYTQIAVFPLNTVVVISVCLLCAILGKKVLGKFAKYVAL